jgi:N-methylhydantoinase A/oxoprolinase/acetone carboxylase beta subunit
MKRIAVDIGGTFTDIVYVDDETRGELSIVGHVISFWRTNILSG